MYSKHSRKQALSLSLQWQPTAVFLPGEFHRQRSLVQSMGSQSQTQLNDEHFHTFTLLSRSWGACRSVTQCKQERLTGWDAEPRGGGGRSSCGVCGTA